MAATTRAEAVREAVPTAVRALLRAARTLRTYPADNEISQRALDALHAQLLPVLPCRLELRPDEVLVEGEPMLEEADRSDLVSALYADGIRRLDLAEGLDRAELERFVLVLATPIHPDDLSEDYVTHLWEAELAHVRVAAIDPYLDVDLPEDVLEGKDTPSGDTEDVGRVQPAQLEPPPAEAFRIGEKERLHVEQEVLQASAEPPWASFVDALFETLHSPVGLRRPEDVVRLIEETFHRLVTDHRLAEAQRLLDHLATRPPDRARALMRSAVGRMVDAERLGPLHDALESDAVDRELLANLLLRLRPFVCETLCAFLERTAQEPVRRFYADLLVQTGSAALQPVLDHLPGAGTEARPTFVRVLGRLRAPEATPPLLRALDDAEAPLRREIARSLAQIRTPEALAALLDLALDDADRRVRVIALRGLGEARSGIRLPRLLDRIRSPRFAGLGDEEKDLLFGVLGAVGDEAAVGFLAQALDPPWWSLRRDPAGWERAARALAAIASPPARRALERAAGSRRREIAEAAARALEGLGTGDRP